MLDFFKSLREIQESFLEQRTDSEWQHDGND